MKTYRIGLLFFLVGVLHAQNVGIGTALPASKLSIAGNLSVGSSYAGVSAPANGAIIEGNVGIGTANPLAKLHVTGVPVGAIHTPGFNGDVLLVEGSHGCVQIAGFGTGAGAAHLIITNTANGNRHWTINHMATGGWQNKFTIGYLETSGAGWFPWGSKMFVTIDTSGNVGIGTTNPTFNLDVRKLGNKVLRLGNGAGNDLTFDIAAGAGLANIVAGAEWTGAQYIYTGTRGASRIRLHDGNIQLSIGGTSGIAGNPVTWNTALTINSAGNVGIGTTNPLAKLDIEDSSPVRLRLFHAGVGHNDPFQIVVNESIGNAGQFWIVPGDDFDAGSPNDKLHIGDYNTGVSRFTIQGNGNVGIGTMAPTYQLQFSLNSAAKPGSNTWTVISDERLKRITGKYQKGLKEILQLEPITYYYINNKDSLFDPRVLEKENIGFTAQAVAKIFPEAVDTASNGYLGLDIHPILIAYVNAIKELNNVTKQLNEKNEELIAKTQELEARVKEIAQLKAEIGQLNTEIESLRTELNEIRILLEVKAER